GEEGLATVVRRCGSKCPGRRYQYHLIGWNADPIDMACEIQTGGRGDGAVAAPGSRIGESQRYRNIDAGCTAGRDANGRVIRSDRQPRQIDRYGVRTGAGQSEVVLQSVEGQPIPADATRIKNVE